VIARPIIPPHTLPWGARSEETCGMRHLDSTFQCIWTRLFLWTEQFSPCLRTQLCSNQSLFGLENSAVTETQQIGGVRHLDSAIACSNRVPLNVTRAPDVPPSAQSSTPSPKPAYPSPSSPPFFLALSRTCFFGPSHSVYVVNLW